MNKMIVERKKLEICDCGPYIRIRKYGWINKSWIVGVRVATYSAFNGIQGMAKHDQGQEYRVIIMTIVPDFTVSIQGFEHEDECVEICNYIMDMCCGSTPKEI